MAFLETTTKFILDLLTENEELKKFPQEFVSESVKWVKSWFLTPEDPKSNAKLQDPNKSLDVKKDIIQDKLADLNDNAQFVKELAARMAAFEQHKPKRKGIVENSDIDAKGNVHIGDKGNLSSDPYDEKNIVKGSQIKAGGNFRLGDDTITGNEQVHIIHNYFNGKAPEKTPIQPNNLKSALKTLLRKGKTAEVLEQLLDFTENKDEHTHQTVLVLSAQFNRLNTRENRGVIDNQEATLLRNRLEDALVNVINDLEIDG